VWQPDVCYSFAEYGPPGALSHVSSCVFNISSAFASQSPFGVAASPPQQDRFSFFRFADSRCVVGAFGQDPVAVNVNVSDCFLFPGSGGYYAKLVEVNTSDSHTLVEFSYDIACAAVDYTLRFSLDKCATGPYGYGIFLQKQRHDAVIYEVRFVYVTGFVLLQD
jgi:hypothetical protein